MKLTFYGAAHEVTGSCHCIEVAGKRILIDCGLQQGRDEKDDQQLPFKADSIDCVLITHAHIDHSGRLPLLVKNGFHGQIFAIEATCELLSIMLRDSGHIQEMDAQWENRKRDRSGKDLVEPLYTAQDAEAVLPYLVPCQYGQPVQVCDGATAVFFDAGHLLGSSSVELLLEESGTRKKVVFSGDIGNTDQPIIRDPQHLTDADYVVMESTYGDRSHPPATDYTADLARIIDETLGRGGNVIIPSFAVGRTQELLYFIRDIKERGLVRRPDFPVYVDSPLAVESTRIYARQLHTYADSDAQAILRRGKDPLSFPDLHLCQTSEESKLLNFEHTPKIIISASGMCEAGRIRHHLKHNLWRPECTVVFVGYQAEGTLGRILLEGAKEVKLFGEQIAVKARIVNFPGLSAHADKEGLLRWAESFSPRPRQIFVVHGENTVCDKFVGALTLRGLAAHAPNFMEIYDLVSGQMLAQGRSYQQLHPLLEGPRNGSSNQAFARLVTAGSRLLDVIGHNAGGANKDLAKFRDQILALCDKWDR
ncbi:MBL fold metallo-hydrolase RNA specificity domain-containing protein [Neobittarella massiliensis]|uniref:MBL fold metallo-hydrolase n=2 Tax=Oscillospiraceae TaxID=216572 RepID=A0A8J6IP76_9FIRM|nr:MBL fold metallo-hydrolase [Neobittarella massiliensis]MBC3516355.1 MBL fold metallo-hydrolase [Neobittarella massiliensis]SCJ87517.1 Ribonuclease TTHA0252 [uncultured Anaerotruncus sp.]